MDNKQFIEECKNSIAGFGSLSSSESLRAVRHIEIAQEEIERLEKENKALRCCGNCKNVPAWCSPCRSCERYNKWEQKK